MDPVSLLALAGLVVGSCSIASSVVNHIIRSQTDAGSTPPPWILTAAAVLNAVALNGDKALQLVKGYRGPSAPR